MTTMSKSDLHCHDSQRPHVPMSSLGLIGSLLLRARLWLGKKRFPSLGLSVVRVSRSRIIKGPCEPSELEAMRYVALRTSIPVPKVHQSYYLKNHFYIEMEFIHGDTLQDLWAYNALSPDEKQSLVKQAAAYIEQLRALKPAQEGTVASAELGQCLDYRIGYQPFGPFKSNDEFHSFLRGQIPLEDSTQVYGAPVTQCHSGQYRSCFTHADFCPRNAIVRDGAIVAIIDWQFAGWYPEYWEYTKAHFALLNMPDWYELFRNAVSRYDDELAAERVLWERFDQPGMLQQSGLAND